MKPLILGGGVGLLAPPLLPPENENGFEDEIGEFWVQQPVCIQLEGGPYDDGDPSTGAGLDIPPTGVPVPVPPGSAKFFGAIIQHVEVECLGYSCDEFVTTGECVEIGSENYEFWELIPVTEKTFDNFHAGTNTANEDLEFDKGLYRMSGTSVFVPMSSFDEMRELAEEFKGGIKRPGNRLVPEIGGNGQPSTTRTRVTCLGDEHGSGSFRMSLSPPAGWPNVPGATDSQFKEILKDWNWCIL